MEAMDSGLKGLAMNAPSVAGVKQAKWPTFRDVLGPGLITGASDDDPSGIATYSQAGAQFGYNLGWTLLFTYPLMCAIQLISAQIGRVTGRGLAGNIKRIQPGVQAGVQKLKSGLRLGDFRQQQTALRLQTLPRGPFRQQSQCHGDPFKQAFQRGYCFLDRQDLTIEGEAQGGGKSCARGPPGKLHDVAHLPLLRTERHYRALTR